eukprot:629406-Amphidinium_carterae.1
MLRRAALHYTFGEARGNDRFTGSDGNSLIFLGSRKLCLHISDSIRNCSACRLGCWSETNGTHEK